MKEIRWRWSSEQTPWAERQGCSADLSADAQLCLNGQQYQKMYGFGACFNELGWRALNVLSEADSDELLEELFSPARDGAKLDLCRLPIGGNDYSLDWYSLDEVPGDYELAHFSIARDKQTLIPYIKRALAHTDQLKLLASPWSPPTWMKEPPVYNWGKLIRTEQNMRAYADYFVKFVKAYAEEGIHIDQVHLQNEPVADQKFSSCMWTGKEMRDFIRDYWGPAFRKAGLDTELWLGTINAPGCDYRRLLFDKWATEDYDYYANIVLNDPEALQYLAGVSYQWGGKIAIQRTFESWYPRLRLMQTENECGFGDNTWEYAFYTWTMLKHYIGNGAESYLYWNLMLEPSGVSTWGDPQNAMITVDPETRRYYLNPEYYVMKHFSSIIQRGAFRMGVCGSFAGDSLGFQNPDGSYALEMFNPFDRAFSVAVTLGTEHFCLVLEPRSVNSILIQ